MKEILNSIINLNTPPFISIGGDLILMHYVNESKNKVINTNNTLIDDACIEDKIEIYFDLIHEQWDIRDAIEYVKRLYTDINCSYYQYYDVSEELLEIEILEIFLDNLTSALNIGTKNEMFRYFGYGKEFVKFNLENDDSKDWRSSDSVVLHKFAVASNITEYYVLIKLVGSFNNIAHIIKEEKFLDILQIYYDKMPRKNKLKMYSVLNQEDYINVFKNKTININLDSLKRSLMCVNYTIGNKMFMKLIKQIRNFTRTDWKVYLNYKNNNCRKQNCLCKIRINIRTLLQGVVNSLQYYSTKKIKVNIIDEKNAILVYWGEIYIKKDNNPSVKIEDWIYLDNYERKFKENNTSEFESVSVVVDNSYKNYITILNKLILNQELTKYFYKPENLIRFNKLEYEVYNF